MRTLLLMIFLWNILTLNSSTHEHFLSPFYSAVVLQKQLLYFQDISIKSHQSNLLPFASGILPSPPQELLQGPSSRGRVPKKGPKSSFENKRMHSENRAYREGLLGFLSFSFSLCARVCIYFVRWSFKRKTWLEELFKTRNSRVVK